MKRDDRAPVTMIGVKVNKSDRALLTDAAALERRKLAQFVRESALAAAASVVRRQVVEDGDA